MHSINEFHCSLNIIKIIFSSPKELGGLPCSFQSLFSITGTGKTSNRWSAITYRIALAVFTRSPAAYEALKSYGILQLPSLSAIKQFTSANYQPAGTTCNFEHLQEARKSYTAYIEERVEQGHPKPMRTGVVIFDEVKVVMKVHWNSADNG